MPKVDPGAGDFRPLNFSLLLHRLLNRSLGVSGTAAGAIDLRTEGGCADFGPNAFHFVEDCSEKNWKRACEKDEWPVGVTARHIGTAHLETVGLARMIVKGETLPEFTMEQLAEMANEHARQHAGCTRGRGFGSAAPKRRSTR